MKELKLHFVVFLVEIASVCVSALCSQIDLYAYVSSAINASKDTYSVYIPIVVPLSTYTEYM